MLWRHSALYLLARGVPGLVNLAALAIYTRLLAPDAYGRYALVIAAVVFGNKLVFEWLRLALLRFLPVLQARPEVLRSTVAAGFAGLMVITVAAGGAAWLVIGDPLLRHLVVAGIVLLWAQALFELHLELARGQLQPVRYGILAVARATLALALGVALVLWGLEALGIILGLIGGALLTVCLPLRQELRAVRLRYCDWAVLGQFAHYGAPLAATAALSVVIASSDRFLIGWLLGDDAVGRYAVGYDLANQTIGILLMVVNLAGYPLALRALEHQGIEAARQRLALNLTTLLGIGLPATVGLIVLAGPITEILVGPRFRAEAAALIPLIAVAALLRDVKAYYMDLAFHLGRRTVRQLWVTVVAAGASVALNLLLIPVFGIQGAAYSAIAAYILALILSWGLGRAVFSLPGPDADCLKVTLAALGMGVAVWGLTGAKGIGPLVGQVLGGVLVYGALLWLLDVADARARVLTVIDRWRRREAGSSPAE
jgi:O-antigen/teichoic acid export membrane protein